LVAAFEGNVRLVRNAENVGFGKACNQAAALMEGNDAYLILNPDVEVDPDTVEALWTHMHSNSKVGIIGPRLTYPDGTVQDSYRRFPRPLDQLIKRTPLRKARFLRDRVRGYLMWDKDKDRTEDVDWLVGACLLVRAETWQAVGGFDERFFLFYEDVDLCRRTWRCGYRVVYHPAARALHRLSEGGLLSIFTKRTLRIHLASALKYFWKWRGGPGQAVTPYRTIPIHQS
jgi:GT2 family glycosyltransferase